MTIHHRNLEVTWFGYATVRLETDEGFVAYLDPGRYGVLTGEWTPPGGGNPREAAHPRAIDHRPEDADLVCVTHEHHYDSDGIERVAGEDATVVVFEGVDVERIDHDDVVPESLPYDVVRVDEAAHLAIGDADVWTVAAYNDPETRERVVHPPGLGCGFLLSLGGTTVFWAGDSDALDAFAELEVSLYLANICGGATASDEREAADLAERMGPDLAMPIHYNTLENLRADSAMFVTDVAKRGVPVVLDERGP